jgi:predicted small integral membrane protein
MKTKKNLSSLFLSIYLFLISTSSVLAQDPLYTDSEGDQIATLGWIVTLAENVLSIALQLIGVVAFVMMLVGGIKILTSGGNPEAMEAAKKTLTMAIAGLAIAVFSWFILNILGVITGVSLTDFAIPTLSPTRQPLRPRSL